MGRFFSHEGVNFNGSKGATLEVITSKVEKGSNSSPGKIPRRPARGSGSCPRRMNANTYVGLSIGTGVALVSTAYVTWDRPQVPPPPLAPAESIASIYGWRNIAGFGGPVASESTPQTRGGSKKRSRVAGQAALLAWPVPPAPCSTTSSLCDVAEAR